MQIVKKGGFIFINIVNSIHIFFHPYGDSSIVNVMSISQFLRVIFCNQTASMPIL